VVVTIAKVFLFDLAGLEGILRALSSIGLGLALMSIGLGPVDIWGIPPDSRV
jgi:uncharacterized membrane protein